MMPALAQLEQLSMAPRRRLLEEFLTALRKGTDLMKHGRHGKPKVHYFRLANNDTMLSWRSAKGKLRGVLLRNVKQVVPGQTTEIFKRHLVPHLAPYSFSLLYKDEDEEGLRTLDVTCKSQQEFELWFWGIQAVMDRLSSQAPAVPPPLQQLGPPAVSHGSAPAAPLPRMTRNISFESANSSGRAHGMGGGIAQGRATGAMGVPVLQRVPGDCYVWGSSEAAAGGKPQVASAIPGWQHSNLPTLVDNTMHLDVFQVAVGMRHAALLTHGGELYTWGHGAGGKLGLGNSQDAASPQRVHTLWGKSVKSIECGDACSAAITYDGALYTWGDGSVGSLGYANTLRQFIPRRVEKGLGPCCVVQVSCGPYHSAALTSDGRLFTWGDGLCGKLGHGDSVSRSEPQLVTALADQRVLDIACGVWHTACIATQRAEQEALQPRQPLEALQRLDSAASAAAHAYPEAQEGGNLYTWGGKFTWVDHKRDKAGQVTHKRDHHRGCLGLGDTEGRLHPVQVTGPWGPDTVCQVKAGLNLTVVLIQEGKVFQMGETGASGRAKWEGCLFPEPVGGSLTSHAVERISVGMQHVAALVSTNFPRSSQGFAASPLAAGTMSSIIFMWGRGQEGQLGVGTHQDSAQPRPVERLQGRRVLQVACGGYHTLAVCEHDSTQQEAAERSRGYKQRMMQLFSSKPAGAMEAPEGIQHGNASATSSVSLEPSKLSGGNAPLVAYSSTSDLSVTPRAQATDMRAPRMPPQRGSGQGSMMGLARAAAAVRRQKGGPNLQRRRSMDSRSFGPGVRLVGGGKQGTRANGTKLLTMAPATISEFAPSLSARSALSDASLRDNSQRSDRISEAGSIMSAPDTWLSERGAERSGLLEDPASREGTIRALESKVERLEGLLSSQGSRHTSEELPLPDLEGSASVPLQETIPEEGEGAFFGSPARLQPDAAANPRRRLSLDPGAASRSPPQWDPLLQQHARDASGPEPSRFRGRISTEAPQQQQPAGQQQSASPNGDAGMSGIEQERRELARMRQELEAKLAELDLRQGQLDGQPPPPGGGHRHTRSSLIVSIPDGPLLASGSPPRRMSTISAMDKDRGVAMVGPGVAPYASELTTPRQHLHSASRFSEGQPASAVAQHAMGLRSHQLGTPPSGGSTISRASSSILSPGGAVPQSPGLFMSPAGHIVLQDRMAERHRRSGSVASGAGQQQAGSPLQPGAARQQQQQQQQQPELEDVRTEEVHPGVFLTLGRRADGQAMLKRIRFSRQSFNKEAADAWWLEHKQELALRYNLASLLPAV